MKLSQDEIDAIGKMLEFCDQQTGRSHQGYFSSTQGWCGMHVKSALDKLNKPQSDGAEYLKCPDCGKLLKNTRWLGTIHLCS